MPPMTLEQIVAVGSLMVAVATAAMALCAAVFKARTAAALAHAFMSLFMIFSVLLFPTRTYSYLLVRPADAGLHLVEPAVVLLYARLDACELSGVVL